MPNYFEIHAINVEVMARTNPEGRTHIHRTEIVTTTARSPQAGSTKTVSNTNIITKKKFKNVLTVSVLTPCKIPFKILYIIFHMFEEIKKVVILQT